jgi:hypothetical protein
LSNITDVEQARGKCECDGIYISIHLHMCVEAMYNPELGAIPQNFSGTYIGVGYIYVTVHYIVSLFTMCYVTC